MLADVEADALFGLVDLVITGHFSSPEQVVIAADALARVQAGVGAGAREDRGRPDPRRQPQGASM